MSEETKAVEATNEATPQETQQPQETQSQETKTMSFTQQQLDNIIKTRLEAEKKNTKKIYKLSKTKKQKS